MDKLDQLHIVSDLHLGGVPGHQICNQGAALGGVIDHLAAAAPGQRLGLVLNGDIVDFLAAEDARHFDPTGAPRKLQAIFDDPAFEPVWSALARFTAVPGRVLVLVLGNHDVELALPDVQAMLLARICGDDGARGRVRVAMDGTGYTCLVGGRRVLAIHGNDADPWNIVDHAGLRAFIKAQNEGAPPPPVQPNAGTRLVIDVMNGIKRLYPFVDLLKPETVPVPGVLLALPADLHPPLLDFARITARLAVGMARVETGFLGGPSAPVAPAASAPTASSPADGYRALEQITRGDAAAPPRTDAALTATAWLKQAEDDFAQKRRPLDVLDAKDGEEMLGLGTLMWDRLMGRDPRDALREALQKYLVGDDTFRFDTEDGTYRALDREVGPEVHFLIAGHTHLERRLPRTRGGGVYFNSGTWIRLIQIQPEQLATRETFEPVYGALSGGRLTDLDALPNLVQQRRTLVSIWKDGDDVHGELRHALSAHQAAGAPSAPPWEPVLGSRFTSPSLER
jgi:UDP-2,3-diacylglucosamine pyrophosphatase LpxH